MTEADVSPQAEVTGAAFPPELPVLPSHNLVLFPYMIVPLSIDQPALIKLIDDAAVGDKLLVFVWLPGQTDDVAARLPIVGTVATVARMLKMPDGSVQVILQGLSRARVLEAVQTEPYTRARVEALPDSLEMSNELEALQRSVVTQFQRAVALSPQLPDEVSIAAANITEPGKLADLVTVNLGLQQAQKQEILETPSVEERLRRVLAALSKELEILEIGGKIQSQMKEQIDKQQREYYLREQLKAIQRELGETDDHQVEVDELRAKIKEAHLPEEANKEAERELDRLSRMSPASPEYGVTRTYLDWMAALPWRKSTPDNLDIQRAETVLDEDHYDLEKIKRRIVQYLAVRKLKEDAKGPILCFVGPPGVGKTSLGQSIARALGRKFVRLSLGAVRDEAEVRGHRRTYIGALPGRIIQGIRRAESNNPVFMLDEVDKLGMDFRGDPSSALLEVLDPAQNSTFVDHYLDVPFDLSKVMFIATANMLDPIPAPLRDRMEVLELSGYTELDKLNIARRYLVPRQLSENGIPPDALEITDEAIEEIIRYYTAEAGVRNLEREIGAVCRHVARDLAAGETGKQVVTAANVEEYLGHRRTTLERAGAQNEVGVATGLAVTAVGGDVLFVEAALVPGHGGLTLTGKLGEVMQESARAALTYTRSRTKQLGIPDDFYERLDIHVHVPAGAVPKDGPSAGVTLATALVSALTERPVRSDVAMTGEVTLRGKVLPIGGLKEKVLAAHRAGIKTVVFPKNNEGDLDDVPAQVREEMEFVPVNHMDQVLSVALAPAVQIDTAAPEALANGA